MKNYNITKKMKQLLQTRPYGTSTNAFLYEWEGHSRVPKTIKFPDGLEKRVNYMRDGVMAFKNEEIMVTYERLLDHPSKIKSIVVYQKVNDPGVCN